MAYISIIDLPELKNDIKGTEYLLITNTDLESNKIQLSTISQYLTSDITNNIYLDIDNRVTDAVDQAITDLSIDAKIKVFDEGIEVGTSSKINFIGANVNSFINDDTSIDIYIPSVSSSSHFNTQDGNSNAIISKTNFENRYISRPQFDGAPFRIGDWQPGTLKKCVKDNIQYVLTDYVYLDKICSFKFYIIQNNSIIDYLEVIPNNGSFQSNFIQCVVSNKIKEMSHFKCNISFSFNLLDSIKGRFLLKAEYVGSSGTFSFIEDELFFDNNSVQPIISNNVNFNTISNKFLSGVKFIGQNSTISVNCILQNAKNLTYPNNIMDIDGSLCGLSQYNLTVADLNVVDYTYNTDIVLNKEYTLLSNKFYNNVLTLKTRVNDWSKGEYVSTNFNGLVDTYIDSSTRVYEDFVSETNRLNQSFTQFASNIILTDSDLQVYNSRLVYPQLDFSSLYDNPNYSSFIGVRNYIRRFWHSNVSHSNGIFSFLSNIKEEDLNTKIKIEISLDSINWYNCGLEYLGGALTNNSGCRINSDTNSLNINNKIEFTLGLNKFTNSASSWGILVKITFFETAKDKYIDVLQITNW